MIHFYYNTLNLFYNGSYLKLRQARDKFSSWQAAWEAEKKNSRLDPEKEWEKLENAGVRLILADDPEFPALLKEIPWCPFGLYVKGEAFGETPKVAIVGTRKATLSGRNLAYKIAKDLSLAGVTVVSGLALGIDSAAHQGAVEAQGKTIAVLAGGLDWVYPRQNSVLAEKILSLGGLLVSEYPLGPVAYAARFLERNRLISGLSAGILVAEAPEASGALATAKFALEHNREIFVTPGPATHPNYVGSHSLLRAGARIITSAEDILEDLNLVVPNAESANRQFPFSSKEQGVILDILKNAGEPVNIDRLQEMSKIDISILNQNLTLLLIQGVIKEDAGKYFIS